jgi:hypothetical protein
MMNAYEVITENPNGKGQVWVQFSENQESAQADATRNLERKCPQIGEHVKSCALVEFPTEYESKIYSLAQKIQAEQMERFQREAGESWQTGNWFAWHVFVKPGRKYVNVDVGSSGKYMITPEGEIYGIKGYGVIHRGHFYGTLDTINQWNWSNYTAYKVA